MLRQAIRAWPRSRRIGRAAYPAQTPPARPIGSLPSAECPVGGIIPFLWSRFSVRFGQLNGEVPLCSVEAGVLLYEHHDIIAQEWLRK
jgi:hypothetical protein